MYPTGQLDQKTQLYTTGSVLKKFYLTDLWPEKENILFSQNFAKKTKHKAKFCENLITRFLENMLN